MERRDSYRSRVVTHTHHISSILKISKVVKMKFNSNLPTKSFLLLLVLLCVSSLVSSSNPNPSSSSSPPETLQPRDSPFLCRCTCFQTNTTVIPLYAPSSTSNSKNPCTSCTRQFCLDQNLEGCKDAKIERPDADTGTGWEGEVWARCLSE